MEILETTAMRDLDAVSRRIQECAKLGVDFSLDDFGTGYSSLTYFRHLPVTFLKIDRSFVANILDNAEDQALVESLINMAHALNRKVIAEGVETIDHGIPLLRYGCDHAQGFGIARPMPPDEVIPWIRSWRIPDSWKALSPDFPEDLLSVAHHPAKE
jgi:EAL domain-containing protein (putative c-di-GMP-specific phosphodiesterase class I)